MDTNPQLLAAMLRRGDVAELARALSWRDIVALADRSREFREALDAVDGEALFGAFGNLSEGLPPEVEHAISPSEAYGEELAHLVHDVLVPHLRSVAGWELVEDQPIAFVTAVNALSATISTQLGAKAAFGTSVCWQVHADVTRLPDAAFRSYVHTIPEIVLSHRALATEVAYCLERDEVDRDVETFISLAFQCCVRMPRLLPDFLRIGVLHADRVELKLLAPHERITEAAVRWARTDDRESEEALAACDR